MKIVSLLMVVCLNAVFCDGRAATSILEEERPLPTRFGHSPYADSAHNLFRLATLKGQQGGGVIHAPDGMSLLSMRGSRMEEFKDAFFRFSASDPQVAKAKELLRQCEDESSALLCHMLKRVGERDEVAPAYKQALTRGREAFPSLESKWRTVCGNALEKVMMSIPNPPLSSSHGTVSVATVVSQLKTVGQKADSLEKGRQLPSSVPRPGLSFQEELNDFSLRLGALSERMDRFILLQKEYERLEKLWQNQLDREDNNLLSMRAICDEHGTVLGFIRGVMYTKTTPELEIKVVWGCQDKKRLPKAYMAYFGDLFRLRKDQCKRVYGSTVWENEEFIEEAQTQLGVPVETFIGAVDTVCFSIEDIWTYIAVLWKELGYESILPDNPDRAEDPTLSVTVTPFLKEMAEREAEFFFEPAPGARLSFRELYQAVMVENAKRPVDSAATSRSRRASRHLSNGSEGGSASPIRGGSTPLVPEDGPHP